MRSVNCRGWSPLDRKKYRRFIIGRLTIGVGWTRWPYWRYMKRWYLVRKYGWWHARLGPVFIEVMVLPKAFKRREEVP